MEKHTGIDVIGIAGIMPLDYFFLLESKEAVKSARGELRSIQLPLTEPLHLNFIFEGFQKSGGGKIANILALLGQGGHRVVACGAVGNDRAGEIVKHDLEKQNINTHYVKALPNSHTRIVFLLYKEGWKTSEQIHRKAFPLARYTPSLLEGLPSSKYLLLGRANQSVINYAIAVQKSNSTKISFHLTSFPWRQKEKDLAVQLFKICDLAVIWEPTAREICSFFGIDFSNDLGALLNYTSAKIIAVYGGLNHAKIVGGQDKKVLEAQNLSGVNIQGLLSGYV